VITKEQADALVAVTQAFGEQVSHHNGPDNALYKARKALQETGNATAILVNRESRLIHGDDYD
jgi:hypothetical protein